MKLGRALALLIVLAASLVAGPVHAAEDDPYSPAVDTSCNVRVPATVKPGHRVVATARVRANSPTRPTGRVSLTVRKGATVIWSRSVDYPGHAIRVNGPILGVEGSYRITAAFRADDPRMFRRCSAEAEFAVDTAGDDTDDDNPNGPSGQNPGGILPNTGGPDLMWLLLGLALVGGGTGAVVYARRRGDATEAAPALG